MIYFFEETSSTNDDAKELRYTHGDVVWAERQSAGRGQRGNKWVGGEGENITFSVVLEPDFLRAEEQFFVSQITALALISAMREVGIEAKIKWTNDIYVGDMKMAGILIENSLFEGVVARSIVGIGLNVNQLEFDPALPNPTSMRRESGQVFSTEETLRRVHSSLINWFERLRDGDRETITEEYHNSLYRLGEPHTFRLAGGQTTLATIEGVAPHGELKLLHDDGSRGEYLFREVEFVIPARDKK